MAFDGDSPLTDAILVITISAVILSVGIVAMNELAVMTDNEGAGDERVETAGTFDSADEWEQLGSLRGGDEEVVTSRGYAIGLTGSADSYFETTNPIDLGNDGTWSISAWGSVDSESSGETMAAISVDGRAVVAYNGSAGEWVGWYYNESTRNSYTVSVPAANQPATLSQLTLRSNGTHLSLYRNNTVSASEEYVASAVSGSPQTTQNWDGRVEEVRVFGAAVSDSQRQQLVDEPIAPVSGADRLARIMFDEPYRNQQRLLYSSGGIATSNSTFDDGLSGETLGAGRLLSPNHYDWDSDGPRVKLNDGTPYSDYPIVYVDYTRDAFSTDTISEPFTDAVMLVGVCFVVLILGVVVTQLRGRN